MKTLIVYFSLNGNTRFLAEKIHRKLPNATLHRVELAKHPIKSKLLQIIVYGFKTTFYHKMNIRKSNLDLAQYDAIIIGSPVWVGNVPPPMLEFFKQYDLSQKKIAAFCSMGGEPSKFFEDLKKAVGISTLTATLSVIDPLQNLNESTFKAIDDFAKQLKKAFVMEKELKLGTK